MLSTSRLSRGQTSENSLCVIFVLQFVCYFLLSYDGQRKRIFQKTVFQGGFLRKSLKKLSNIN